MALGKWGAFSNAGTCMQVASTASWEIGRKSEERSVLTKEAAHISEWVKRHFTRLRYREIVVFNENQVYPAYICRYERVLKKESE